MNDTELTERCPGCGREWSEPMGAGCNRPWHHADEWEWECTDECPEDCEADHKGEE